MSIWLWWTGEFCHSLFCLCHSWKSECVSDSLINACVNLCHLAVRRRCSLLAAAVDAVNKKQHLGMHGNYVYMSTMMACQQQAMLEDYTWCTHIYWAQCNATVCLIALYKYSYWNEHLCGLVALHAGKVSWLLLLVQYIGVAMVSRKWKWKCCVYCIELLTQLPGSTVPHASPVLLWMTDNTDVPRHLLPLTAFTHCDHCYNARCSLPPVFYCYVLFTISFGFFFSCLTFWSFAMAVGLFSFVICWTIFTCHVPDFQNILKCSKCFLTCFKFIVSSELRNW